MTHSSPSSTAVVFIPAGSEPASGSDSANAGDHSPEAHFGRKRSFELIGAEQLDRQRAELLHHQDQRAGGVDLGDLLDRHVQHQRARAGAPVLARRTAARGCPARRASCGCPTDTRPARRSRPSAARSSRARSGRSSRRSRGSPGESCRRRSRPALLWILATLISRCRARVRTQTRSTSIRGVSRSGWREDPAPQVIDVREAYEREAGHIAGTRHIELDQPHRRRPRPSSASGRWSSTAASARARRWPPRRSGRLATRPTRWRRPATMGGRGPAAGARGRQRGRPLTRRSRTTEERRRWRLPSTQG